MAVDSEQEDLEESTRFFVEVSLVSAIYTKRESLLRTHIEESRGFWRQPPKAVWQNFAILEGDLESQIRELGKGREWFQAGIERGIRDSDQEVYKSHER